MSPETAIALEKSIQKWLDIWMGRKEDNGRKDCALCLLFWNNGCFDCPVSKRVMHIDCHNTPYSSWDRHYRSIHNVNAFPNLRYHKRVYCSQCAEIAKEEYFFLCSLREKS